MLMSSNAILGYVRERFVLLSAAQSTHFFIKGDMPTLLPDNSPHSPLHKSPLHDTPFSNWKWFFHHLDIFTVCNTIS